MTHERTNCENKIRFSFSLARRFDSLISSCSITNADVQFNQVAAEDELPQDFSALEPNCSVPIVHLKSEILETESLNLLTEETYVDSHFTNLPVGSIVLF